MDRICITGIGIVSPIGIGKEEFLSSLKNGKSGIEEKVNLQKDGNKAKPYQVRQVRQLILKYNLGGDA